MPNQVLAEEKPQTIKAYLERIRAAGGTPTFTNVAGQTGQFAEPNAFVIPEYQMGQQFAPGMEPRTTPGAPGAPGAPGQVLDVASGRTLTRGPAHPQAAEPKQTANIFDPVGRSTEQLKQMLPELFSMRFPNRPIGAFKDEKEMNSFYQYAQGVQKALAEKQFKEMERYEKLMKEFTGASVKEYKRTGDPTVLKKLQQGFDKNIDSYYQTMRKKFWDFKGYEIPKKADGTPYTVDEWATEETQKMRQGLADLRSNAPAGGKQAPGTEGAIPETGTPAKTKPAEQTQASKDFEKNVRNRMSQWNAKLEAELKKQGLKGGDLYKAMGERILEKWGDPNEQDPKKRAKDAAMRMQRYFATEYGKSLGRPT